MKKVISNKKYRIISSLRSELIDYGYGEFHLIHTVFKVQVKHGLDGLLLKNLKKMMKMMLNLLVMKLKNYIIK